MSASHLCVLWQVKNSMHSLGVMVPGLLLICQVSIGLWQGQKPPDGAQVFPKSTVFWAWILLSPKQFTEPTLEKKMRKNAVVIQGPGFRRAVGKYTFSGK